MPASPTATPEHIKDVNTRYHDVAAESYDAKWGIDFGSIGQDQVGKKLRKTLGFDPAEPFADALEIGSGTGYFSLNLMQAGFIAKATATDISPGMLKALATTAKRLGLEIDTVVTEAEKLPFEDESFDLVFGHAVLHHIPDLAQAMSEFKRVLRPGGVLAFCGEPSRYGDRLAVVPKRAGLLVAPLWRAAMRAEAADDVHGGAKHDADSANEYCGSSIPHEPDGHDLEGEVDVHAFAPGDLRKLIDEAGFAETRVKGEELLSNLYGWGLRTVESTAKPEDVPMRWRRFAFRSYIALQKLDAAALEPHLPPELFYNLLVSGRKPA